MKPGIINVMQIQQDMLQLMYAATTKLDVANSCLARHDLEQAAVNLKDFDECLTRVIYLLGQCTGKDE